jgi:hypothetical protein
MDFYAVWVKAILKNRCLSYIQFLDNQIGAGKRSE